MSWPAVGDWTSVLQHHVWTDQEFIERYLPDVALKLQRQNPTVDTLAGCGFGSVPWVVALGLYLRMPYVLVRKLGEHVQCSAAPRDALQVVGRFGPKKRCLFVDDLVSSGETAGRVRKLLLEYEAVYLGTFTIDKAIPNVYSVGGRHRDRYEVPR